MLYLICFARGGQIKCSLLSLPQSEPLVKRLHDGGRFQPTLAQLFESSGVSSASFDPATLPVPNAAGPPGDAFQSFAITSIRSSAPSGGVAIAMHVGSVGAPNQVWSVVRKDTCVALSKCGQPVSDDGVAKVGQKHAKALLRLPVVLLLLCSCCYCNHAVVVM